MKTMTGVYLTGYGGLDKLDYRNDIPKPVPKANEVLIRVAAAGINNTDINTRIGWSSKKVSTDTHSGGTQGFADIDNQDSSWDGAALVLPRIQGADICGIIAAVGTQVAASRVGERVLVRSMFPAADDSQHETLWTVGADMDGGFAQFAVAPARETYRVDCDWSDAELASIPCAYSTAENLLHRAQLGAETVLITGASGGVGSAAVQLAKRRGATVIAVAAAHKAETVRAIGADHIIDRHTDLLAALGKNSVDVVVDLVAGEQWSSLLEVLKRGGRYATAGAIAGPLVTLDVRTLYLKDLSLLGCTFQEDSVFHNLLTYVEQGEIRPLVAKTYPLAEIAQAQTDFMAKQFVGKLVLIPPAVNNG